MQRITLTSTDGVSIAARVYEPDGFIEANVVIGGAMGVRQDFYASFAVRRIGHFGPFRAQQQTKLWPRMAEWLRSLSAPVAA
jgi:predicted alpha/beta hydrolase